MGLATVIINTGERLPRGYNYHRTFNAFQGGYQCFVGTTDGTTGTYIRPEASKYMAFRSRLWAPILLGPFRTLTSNYSDLFIAHCP